LVPEKLNADGPLGLGRKDIDDPSAHRKLAHVGDWFSSFISYFGEVFC
jgi:hypothetical protein